MLGSLRKSRSRQSVGRRKSPSIIINRAALVEDFCRRGDIDKPLLRFRGWPQRRFEALRGNRHFGGSSRKARARPKSWFSPLFLPDSSSASRFTAGAFEIFILSQSGERLERWARFFINTTLSKLAHNSGRRPTADAKSGPEKTSAPSRDRAHWLA